MNARPQILVTGGTGALGSAAVAALRARGYEVTANYQRDEERAQRLANETGCQLARADVREENAVQTLFESRSFSAVIHAAGANRDALLLRTSPQTWAEQMRWLDAAFLVTRASLQTLPVGASLLLVASRVGERGFVGQSAYAASKGAMLGLMRAAAAERRDLKINALCPGYAPSALSQNLSAAHQHTRGAQNIISDSDAAQSLAEMCLLLLDSSQSGQILRPDCRI